MVSNSNCLFSFGHDSRLSHHIFFMCLRHVCRAKTKLITNSTAPNRLYGTTSKMSSRSTASSLTLIYALFAITVGCGMWRKSGWYESEQKVHINEYVRICFQYRRPQARSVLWRQEDLLNLYYTAIKCNCFFFFLIGVHSLYNSQRCLSALQV